MVQHSPIVIEIYSIMEKRINFIDGKYVYDYNGFKYEFEKANIIPHRFENWPGVHSFFQAKSFQATDIFNLIFDELHPY